ncbi:MAG: redoxin domain-containing protein [Candidatus Latescibacteria bacterium]|nr:redoxin domain-containing protein [Candidatus Latescibacterota bacterium]
MRLLPAALLAALLVSSCSDDEASKKADPFALASTFDLADYRGRVVLLNVWATWCGPCRYEIPALIQLRQDFKTDEVAIIGVSVDRGSPQQVRPLIGQFAQHYKINYPILLDPQGILARQYYQGANMPIPLTMIIDQQGKVAQTHLGLPRNNKGKIDPHGVYATDIQALLDRR